MIATSQFTISVINDGQDGQPGSQGPQGVSVTKVVTEYRLSDSSTSLTGSGTGYTWSETKPELPSGKYMWIRERTDLSNNTSSYSNAHCDIVISGLVFDVNRNSNAITSKVWESDITTSINTYDGSTAQAIRDRVTQTETDITGITSRVSSVESTTSSLGTRMTTAESSITQNADNIALMVTVDGTTSALTLTQDMLSAMTSQFVVKDPAGSQTIISGGRISANSITTAMLATDAIKSSNYQASPNAQSPYSATGTFLDLSTGSLYMPQFGVDGTTGAAYFNGQVNADSGKFGDDNSYWNIETVIDYNATSHAALVGTGNPYLQTGNWQVSDNAVATRKYVSTSETAGTASYYKDTGTNTFYDVGMKIPTSFTKGSTDSNVDRYNRAFFYQRRYTGSTAPALDSSWDYPFIVDNDGRVYCTDLIIIGGGSGTTYLPLAGGTITGNLAVNGSFTTNLMLRTNLGSTSASYLTGNAQAIVDHGVTGTLGIGNGGTGKTTWTANGIVYASASNTLSQLGTGTSGQLLKSNGNAAPGWVNQSTIAAGSATNDSDGNAINTTYRKLSDDTFDTIDVTELNAGELIVTGVGRFSNGLYGNLSGTATNVSNSLKIQLNGGTTEGTNQFTFNGSAGKTVNITRSSIGLGAAADKNVDTSISAGSTSANLPTSTAVATFVEGKGYVTSSGVTSVRVQATSPVVSSVNTAQSSTLNTTISLADAYGDTKNPYGTKTANYVLAGPSSGSAAAPSFRTLVAADIPSLTKSKISDFPTTWALSSVTGADDLKAIEALTGTSGMLKKTAANTWALTTVISGISLSDDVFTITKSDGTTETMTVNVTGQIVSGATILTNTNGQALAVGSASKPVYFSNGVPVEGNVIPTITINGGASTAASFYAPTGAGTSGQYLKSNGSGAPTWATFSKSTVGLGNVDNTADANKNVLTATKFASAQSVTLTGDTTGTASSQAGWSITTKTDRLSTVGDNRSTDTTPDDYKNKLIFQGLKTNSKIGSPSTNTYSYLVGLRGWSDNSGGNAHELAFNDSGINRRQGTTTWGAWVKLIDSGNYTDYTVTKTGSGASGTWGISISGNAATATAATNASFLTHKTLDSTTINNTAGTFAFSGYGLPWDGTDWVGLQVGDGADKFQISANGNTLVFRQNDNGGTNASWSNWVTMLTSGNYSSYAVPKSGGEFTGAVTGTSFAATDYISANNSASNAGGVNLYNRSATMEYAIMFRATSNQVKHGYVQGDWATYLTMGGNASNIATRGWIFKDHLNSKGVASISGAGNAVFNGSVTVGGNAANTSGCRLEFDDTLKCLDFLIS